MKRVLLLSAIAFASCGKFNVDKRIQGTWKMSEARLESMTSWQQIPSSELPVIITETNISNPYNTTYTITEDKEHILFNNQLVKIEVKKHSMLWVFENTDSLRFTR